MERRIGFSISSNQLKLIACLCMACDHIGLVLMDNQWMMRAIGRLAFPIFAFLLVEGYRHTSDVRKYFLRLLICAFLSELPFDLAFYGQVDMRGQNVFFTLAAGLLMLSCERLALRNRTLAVTAVVCIMAVSWVMRFDYQVAGLLMILTFYIRVRLVERERVENGNRVQRLYVNLAAMAVIAAIGFAFYGVRELPAALALLPISLYNGRLGTRNNVLKYGFYLFYPVHLAVLAVC